MQLPKSVKHTVSIFFSNSHLNFRFQLRKTEKFRFRSTFFNSVPNLHFNVLILISDSLLRLLRSGVSSSNLSECKIKCICLHLFTVFYLIQPSSKQIICFDFGKQNSVLPILFYVPWVNMVKYCTRLEFPL